LAYSLVEADEGYAMAGFKISDTGSTFCVVKTDEYGTMEWNQTYGAGPSLGFALVTTSDGGYAVAGQENGDFLLVKTDEFGDVEWKKTYNGGGTDKATALIVTSDGGYALAGYNGDFLLVKTDDSGEEEWTQAHVGTGNNMAQSLVETSDGGYLLVGNIESSIGDTDFWAVKTYADGTMEWNQTY
jgi:hypothetical protein